MPLSPVFFLPFPASLLQVQRQGESACPHSPTQGRDYSQPTEQPAPGPLAGQSCLDGNLARFKEMPSRLKKRVHLAFLDTDEKAGFSA